MASESLEIWRDERRGAAAAFAELEHAHRAVGGTGPGRRHLTRQLNHAYVTLLSARFQGFARALHTETVLALAAAAPNAGYQELLLRLARNRALDRRNAHPDVIAEDFGRLGLDVWMRVDALRAGNDERRQRLRELVEWRNAIAHDDVDARLARDALRPRTVTLATCRGWRGALNVLAGSLDRVAADQCAALGLPRPW
jgi:hypothetical protein